MPGGDVPDVSAQTLLKLTVKKIRRGRVAYTDRFKSYDSLMFCGDRHLKVDQHKYFSSGRVYINGLEGFWSWAKERLMKHHGVSRKGFPLYLKELELRHNDRTGKLEGVDNKIKVIKRRAYGFHDLRYFTWNIYQAFAD